MANSKNCLNSDDPHVELCDQERATSADLKSQLKALRLQEKELLLKHSAEKIMLRRQHPHHVANLDMDQADHRRLVLMEAESRIEYFIEDTLVPTYKVSTNGQIIYANQALADLLGYDREDFLSGNLNEGQITPRQFLTIDAERLKDLQTSLVSNIWESERTTAQGKRLAVGVTLRKLAEGSGERMVFLLDLQDIKQLEVELKQRQILFSALVQEMPHIVFAANSQVRMRQFNKRFYELTGVKPTSDEGFAWREALHQGDLDRWDQKWREAVENGNSFSGEFRLLAADGEYYWHIVRALPLVKPLPGQVKGLLKITVENAGDLDHWMSAKKLWIGTATDIDRRKRLMEEVLESAHSFQSLADQIPQIVWTAGNDGRLDFFSNRWYEFSGTTREHRVGLDFALFMHPDDRKEYMNRWKLSVKTGDAFEADVRLKARPGENSEDEGGYVRFLARAVALRNYRGGIAQWVGTWTSID